jgi:hypothetical protein
MKCRITVTEKDGRAEHFKYSSETNARALLDFLDSSDGNTGELKEVKPCREPGCIGHWKTRASRKLTS